MSRPDALQRIYLLALIVALGAVFWLLYALERGATPERGVLGFSPPGGAYDRSRLLEIQPSNPGARVIFTTDGSVPTANVGTLYERPLRLDSAYPGVTVLRAREFSDGVPGPVQNATYIVGVPHSLPLLSIIADPADLQDPQRGILVNNWQRGQEWERPVHVTFIEGDHSASFEIPAGLRIHNGGSESPASRYGTDGSEPSKLSFRLYFRQDYGAARLAYPLFPERQRDTQSYKRLLLLAGDKSNRWTLLEDQLLSEVTAGVDGYAAQGRFVLLFLNGEPWGIYRISERIDRFFLEDGLNMPAADLIQDGRAIAGDGQRWDGLMRWISTHDLSVRGNYAQLATEIDVDSLTDLAILQMYLGRSGGRLSAARPPIQDGRWFWLSGHSDDETNALLDAALTLLGPSDRPGDLHRLLNALLENPDYRARFVGRAADLLNTVLASTVTVARIDRLASQLRPDMGYETDRWASASGDSEWERNVGALRQFAQRRPDALRRHMATEFDLRGMTHITFSRSTLEGGYVIINGTPISDLPWSGIYFLDTQLQVMAVPEPGYVFAGWETGPQGAAASSFTLTVTGTQTLTAHFVPMQADDPRLRPNDVIINEYWINDDGTAYASVGDHSIEGDWLELLVTRPRVVDLRGWRITDNDTKIGTSEGSIILPWLDAFAAVPRGTAILIVATENNANEAQFRRDDLDPSDGQMVFYVGNGHLDVTSDPGFNIGTADDNLGLLAPGPGASFADDVGVDFVAEGDVVTPLSFGVLADGVTFGAPFRGLGNDDGVVFTQSGDNDHGDAGWVVDPTSRQSGDDSRPGATNILSPGRLNYGQSRLSLPLGVLGLLLIGLIGAAAAWWLRARRA